MKTTNVREVLIDFLDKKHFDIKIDQDIEVYDPEEIVDSYLKSINLNQSERQPVTDNKGNGNNFLCAASERNTLINPCENQCNMCKYWEEEVM
jgi:hypothetical protein